MTRLLVAVGIAATVSGCGLVETRTVVVEREFCRVGDPIYSSYQGEIQFQTLVPSYAPDAPIPVIEPVEAADDVGDQEPVED